MRAGAPGALGSLVIFSSSGNTAWKPTAQAAFGTRVVMNTTSNDTRTRELRRGGMALFLYRGLSTAEAAGLKGEGEAVKSPRVSYPNL
jgi:hypothetical protein